NRTLGSPPSRRLPRQIRCSNRSGNYGVKSSQAGAARALNMQTEAIAAQDFDLLESELQSGGPEAALDFMIRKFRDEKNFPLLFETRLMQKRRELGLPLIQIGSLAEVGEDKRPAYEQALIEAAREVGNLFLTEGDISRAWSYFRAIGEPAPVAKAINEV